MTDKLKILLTVDEATHNLVFSHLKTLASRGARQERVLCLIYSALVTETAVRSPTAMPPTVASGNALNVPPLIASASTFEGMEALF